MKIFVYCLAAVSTFVLWFQLRKLYGYIGFKSLKRQYLEAWNLMPLSEKVEILYAFEGSYYEDKCGEVKYAEEKEVSPSSELAQSLYANDLSKEADGVVSSCPSFEKLDEQELLNIFCKKIDFHWALNVDFSDFELGHAREQFEYIFHNRHRLASRIFDKRKTMGI